MHATRENQRSPSNPPTPAERDKTARLLDGMTAIVEAANEAWRRIRQASDEQLTELVNDQATPATTRAAAIEELIERAKTTLFEYFKQLTVAELEARLETDTRPLVRQIIGQELKRRTVTPGDFA